MDSEKIHNPSFSLVHREFWILSPSTYLQSTNPLRVSCNFLPLIGIFQQLFFFHYPSTHTPLLHNQESFQIICVISIQPSILFSVPRLLNSVRENRVIVGISANDLDSRWVLKHSSAIFFQASGSVLSLASHLCHS